MTLPGDDASVGAEEAAVRDWCCHYLAGVTGQPVARIGWTAEFTSLGLDSAELLFMVSALEERFALDLPSDTTTEYSTVEALARSVAARLAARPSGR